MSTGFFGAGGTGVFAVATCGGFAFCEDDCEEDFRCVCFDFGTTFVRARVESFSVADVFSGVSAFAFTIIIIEKPSVKKATQRVKSLFSRFNMLEQSYFIVNGVKTF